jgi:hypothetical protein
MGAPRTFLPPFSSLRSSYYTPLLHNLCLRPPRTDFVCYWIIQGQTQRKLYSHNKPPRAKGRLRVGEAVRTKSGCRMSFLTKNRRTSPQDAPEATQDKFPAAQLGLLGMPFYVTHTSCCSSEPRTDSSFQHWSESQSQLPLLRYSRTHGNSSPTSKLGPKRMRPSSPACLSPPFRSPRHVQACTGAQSPIV